MATEIYTDKKITLTRFSRGKGKEMGLQINNGKDFISLTDSQFEKLIAGYREFLQQERDWQRQADRQTRENARQARAKKEILLSLEEIKKNLEFFGDKKAKKLHIETIGIALDFEDGEINFQGLGNYADSLPGCFTKQANKIRINAEGYDFTA